MSLPQECACERIVCGITRARIEERARGLRFLRSFLEECVRRGFGVFLFCF